MLGVYVAAITEGLSAFHAVTRARIAIAWAAFCVLRLSRCGNSSHNRRKLDTAGQSAEPDDYPGKEMEAKWLFAE